MKTLEKIEVDGKVTFDPEKHTPAITWRDVFNKLELMTNEELDQECVVVNLSPKEVKSNAETVVFCPIMAVEHFPAEKNKTAAGSPALVEGQLYLSALVTGDFTYPSKDWGKRMGIIKG